MDFPVFHLLYLVKVLKKNRPVGGIRPLQHVQLPLFVELVQCMSIFQSYFVIVISVIDILGVWHISFRAYYFPA